MSRRPDHPATTSTTERPRPLGIAGNATPVDTPADDGEIMDAILQAWTSHGPSLRFLASADALRLAVRKER